ncbi:conserved hypothetical protein [Vibrio owensii]|uniref:Uncharacterized protein n=1 Tax=Vibrio owensii TaxID=696485 RepID=A0AAU9Q6L5_9VIBR|nr:conserved hypothetical protein [Vibrio owensii]
MFVNKRENDGEHLMKIATEMRGFLSTHVNESYGGLYVLLHYY